MHKCMYILCIIYTHACNSLTLIKVTPLIMSPEMLTQHLYDYQPQVWVVSLILTMDFNMIHAQDLETLKEELKRALVLRWTMKSTH